MSGKEGFNSFSVEEFLSIRQEEEKIKFKKRRLRAGCTHLNRKGKSRLEPTSVQHEYECRDCKQRIDLRPYASGGDEMIDTLKRDVEKVINAVHIIKFRSAQSRDDKKAAKIVNECASLILNLASVPGLLEAITSHGEEKRKEKKKKNELIITSGGSGLHLKGRKSSKKW